MRILNFRKFILFLIDIVIVVMSYVFVYAALRISIVFDIGPIANEITSFFMLVFCVTAVRYFSRVYANIWRYAGTMEYLNLLMADIIAAVLNLILSYVVFASPVHMMFVLSVSTVSLVAVLLSRLIYRQYQIRANAKKKISKNDKKYTAIVGAGYTGMLLLNEIKNDKKHNIIPYCFIDTDKTKAGSYLKGVKVIHSEDNDIAKILADTPVTDVVLAIPSASMEKKNSIIQNCTKNGYKVKVFEYLYDRADGASKQSKFGIRDVKIEDLLSRGVITFENDTVKKILKDKVVLVTGGGGSIGSELCRQIASMGPKKLIILDIYENNAYEIEQELKRIYGKKLDVTVEIASVRDKEKLLGIFNAYKPHYVFHAAAHKHVPLMEHNIDEAVKNNIFGTYNVVNACEEAGVLKMLLISTDKAVNPSSVMGATKRFCEMIIQSKKNSKTEFVAVRFGNVLGSNGSVIPMFKSQIENGGPVTVTDKRIIRYFMTISEAVNLVLQAFALAHESEIFVLDMGNPVKILDLAENMIRLSGLKPYEDIDIVEIGLRPGEKLYEELLIKSNDLDKTGIEKIFIERNKPISGDAIKGYLDELSRALKTEDNSVIKDCLHRIIPTFVTPVYNEEDNA